MNGFRSATALGCDNHYNDSSSCEAGRDERSASIKTRELTELEILESRIYIGVSSYCSKTGGGPLIRFHFKLTFTSTRLAILMKGMLLFMPKSLRSKAIVPSMLPEVDPLPLAVRVSFSVFVTPRIVKSPSRSNVLGPV